MAKKKNSILITIWIIVCLIVIIGFFVFTAIIGGSALNGYCENGLYFVREHADVVQVSNLVWNVSFIWGILFFIFIPLLPIGALLIEHIQDIIHKRKIRVE